MKFRGFLLLCFDFHHSATGPAILYQQYGARVFSNSNASDYSLQMMAFPTRQERVRTRIYQKSDIAPTALCD